MMLPLGALIVARHRGAVVRGALSRARLDLHPSFIVSENVERYHVRLGVDSTAARGSTCRSCSAIRFPGRCCCRAPRVAAWQERGPASTMLLWCWIAAIVGFFSLSAGKQDLYIFPIVAGRRRPVAAAIERGRLRPEWRAWASATLAVAGALLAVAGAAVLYLFETAGPRLRARRGAVLSAPSASPAAWRPWRLRRARSARRPPRWRSSPRRSPSTGRSSCACCPSSSATSRSRQFSRHARRRASQPGDAVAYYQVSLPSMVYYLRRRVDTYFEERALVDALHYAAAGVRGAVGGDYAGARAADRHADLRHRSPPDLRGEAAADPARASRCPTGADHQPVSVMRRALRLCGVSLPAEPEAQDDAEASDFSRKAA